MSKGPQHGTWELIANQGGAKKRKALVPGNKSARKPTRINLKAVAEVLAERGIDPTEAILDVLSPVDPDTGEALPSKLDPEVKVRVLNELLQYTQPKLKSIEVKSKSAIATFDVNDEQARRIAEEFLKSSAGELE